MVIQYICIIFITKTCNVISHTRDSRAQVFRLQVLQVNNSPSCFVNNHLREIKNTKINNPFTNQKHI